jgi:hypothetical protein
MPVDKGMFHIILSFIDPGYDNLFKYLSLSLYKSIPTAETPSLVKFIMIIKFGLRERRKIKYFFLKMCIHATHFTNKKSTRNQTNCVSSFHMTCEFQARIMLNPQK